MYDKMMYDKIIIGAGLYGMYAAVKCAKRGEHVLVLESCGSIFERATTVNQARIHMGYHYPRSLSTAIKSRNYFDRFVEDYGFCINQSFDKIYATSANFSWTSATQFEEFCKRADIPCESVDVNKYFKEGICDGAFLTKEYAFDAGILKGHFLAEAEKLPGLEIKYNCKADTIEHDGHYIVNGKYKGRFLLNAAYAGVNEINALVGAPLLNIKYELCEVIICKVNFENLGITVMDGPFFSIMPFGKTGYHSLTSVTFTPHATVSGQDYGGEPPSAWGPMSQLARKYLKDEYEFEYVKSLFAVKPILKTSEVDDSRPTAIRRLFNENYVSVLSGKINTLYDLDGEL